MQGRVLAFDFGLNHIGVAVGNELTATAQPLTAIKAANGVADENALRALFDEWRPEFAVVGFPLNMDGSVEAMSKRAKGFAKHLSRSFRLPVYLKDERLSSAQAKDEIFNHGGGYRALVKNKGRIDAAAAKVILEGFFETGGRAGDFSCLLPDLPV